MDKAKLLSRLQAIETYMDCLNKEVRELQEMIFGSKPVRPINPKKKQAQILSAAFKAKWDREAEAGKYKLSLQQQFKLKVPPSANRVLEYLKTRNPAVFDGLMRN